MKRFWVWALLAFLLAATCVPAYAAEEIKLDQGDGSHKSLGGTGDSLHALITEFARLLAGERLQNSALKSYLAVRIEADATIIGVQTAVTIGGGVANDTHLLGVHISKALTGTCVITGFPDTTGAAQSFTLIAATTAGLKEFFGIKNTAGALTITCSDVADDNNVMVLWRPAS